MYPINLHHQTTLNEYKRTCILGFKHDLRNPNLDVIPRLRRYSDGHIYFGSTYGILLGAKYNHIYVWSKGAVVSVDISCINLKTVLVFPYKPLMCIGNEVVFRHSKQVKSGNIVEFGCWCAQYNICIESDEDKQYYDISHNDIIRVEGDNEI